MTTLTKKQQANHSRYSLPPRSSHSCFAQICLQNKYYKWVAEEVVIKQNRYQVQKSKSVRRINLSTQYFEVISAGPYLPIVNTHILPHVSSKLMYRRSPIFHNVAKFFWHIVSFLALFMKFCLFLVNYLKIFWDFPSYSMFFVL